MAIVIVKKKSGESDDSLIRRFKRQVVKAQVLEEYRDHEFYRKPAERRKEARKQRLRQGLR